jgi:DNA-binding LacI/PurR family transcriptional regulator
VYYSSFELAPAGYDLLPFALSGPDARERFLSRLPFRKRVDGMIVVDVPMSDDELDAVAATNVPVVTVGLRTERFPSLTVDNAQGARMATEHLIGLGHRRIGLLGSHGPVSLPFTIPPQRRLGYARALQARGIEVRDELVVEGPISLAGGAWGMQLLLSLDERPTAVLAMSDEAAIGAMQVAQDLGMRIPEQLSIVGFDDHDIAEYIGLTTVRQDVERHGRLAAGWLLEALTGSGRPHHQVLPARLVVRRTTSRRADRPQAE